MTERGPMSGMGSYDDDKWQLFHTDVDRAEVHDLAAQYPEKVKELKALWLEEALKYNVLPLNGIGITGTEIVKFFELQYRVPVPPSGQYTYYPGTSEVPEKSAANTHRVSYKVLAEVEVTDPNAH